MKANPKTYKIDLKPADNIKRYKGFTITLNNGRDYSYQIKNNKRAKYLRISVKKTGDIIITKPPRIREKIAHEFIQSKKSWLDKTIVKSLAYCIDIEDYPSEIELPCFQEKWLLYYDYKDEQCVTLDVDTENKEMFFKGNVENRDALKCLMAQWGKQKARDVLKTYTFELAQECNVEIAKISIRAQKTRWGSCSSNRNISLNYRLIFLPINILNYVIIHELCHTKEMNHSNAFWALVSQYDTEYKHHDKLLLQYEKSLFF